MGQGITVTRAFGWVIDNFEGDYTANLSQFIDDDTNYYDLHDLIETRMKEHGLDVQPDHFGYDHGALALVHRASSVDSYDWEHDLEALLPPRMADRQYERELAQALDALGWDEAGLGEPKWLLLVAYG